METSYIFAIVHLALLVVYLILFRHVDLKKRLLALYPLGIGLIITIVNGKFGQYGATPLRHCASLADTSEQLCRRLLLLKAVGHTSHRGAVHGFCEQHVLSCPRLSLIPDGGSTQR